MVVRSSASRSIERRLYTLAAVATLLVERLALALQASVLLRAGSPVAEAFCRSRLGGQHGLAFGTLPADVNFGALMARAAGG